MTGTTEKSRDGHCVWVQTRGPTGDDPGALAPAYYVIDGDVLTLTGADGKPSDGCAPDVRSCRLRSTDDPDRVARRLARKLLSSGQPFFGRALECQMTVVV